METYKYQDCSHMNDPLKGSHLAVTDIFPIDLRVRGHKQHNVRYHRLPLKLHIILSQEHFSDIICWMPHGRAWRILDTNRLEKEVLPLCFDSANYNSFNRIINAWCFRRITSGPDQGAYYHEMFLRGMPHLHQNMRRLPRNGKKIPMNPKDEPNFYLMPPSNAPAYPTKKENASSPINQFQTGLKNTPHSPRGVALPPTSIRSISPLSVKSYVNNGGSASPPASASPILGSAYYTTSVTPVSFPQTQDSSSMHHDRQQQQQQQQQQVFDPSLLSAFIGSNPAAATAAFLQSNLLGGNNNNNNNAPCRSSSSYNPIPFARPNPAVEHHHHLHHADLLQMYIRNRQVEELARLFM
eukprot:CAMPEP_0118709610 /NCGR_PEP_ID=MMETSP0800-20121206/22764_1 /TAXON_ID=210618 ORGANISM="Striatella unipunctata, Strain CCMP2910" /NCGR_SAMPLE_ID=MMETSP0800 /ASSEMBLY_ACC=CAM_ASM_000638 /LENGTH=352 /DNA_ID=CAMNT_0006613385 /DNA_START=70 /DNA_END=1128 /DNA_ORIENTATION=+